MSETTGAGSGAADEPDGAAADTASERSAAQGNQARTGGPADHLATLMAEHHLWLIGQMVDRAARLSADRLDRPVEVAVDPGTGQVRVLEILSAVDVGEIIHPAGHQMQIDGGTVMGYGFACLEDLVEQDGQIAAANLGEFRLPTMRDVPELTTVLVQGGQGLTAANAKPVGELTNVPVAAAVANAVADAVGCRVRDLPVTAEKVFWLTSTQKDQKEEARCRSRSR